MGNAEPHRRVILEIRPAPAEQTLELVKVAQEMFLPLGKAHGIGGMERDEMSPAVSVFDCAVLTDDLNVPVKDGEACRTP